MRDSGIEGISVGPLDNVERFSQIKSEAGVLQDLIDLEAGGTEEEEITSITLDTEIDKLVGLPVKIVGGFMVSVGLLEEDDSLVSAAVLVKNNEPLEGEYAGLTWRSVRSGTEGSNPEMVFCHVVLTDVDSYFDEAGEETIIKRYKYISATDSDVSILSHTQSHSYERIADDGFCQKLDEIAMNDSMTKLDKLSLIARMFGEISPDNPNLHDLYVHRISYLNHLDMFSGDIVISPYGYSRRIEGQLLVVGAKGGSPIAGHVVMLGLDHRLLDDDKSEEVQLDHKVFSLSVEMVTNQLEGIVSIPYEEGFTQIFSTS